MLIWPTLLVVLGSVFSEVSAQSVPGVSITSAKPSGVLCNTTRCLSVSSCIGSSNCLCPEGTIGQGDFHCYANNSKNAEVSSINNNIRTYMYQAARLLWPCRFRFTEFDLKSSTSNHRLKAQIFGINQRKFSRPLLTGIEVNLQFSDGDRVRGIGLLKTGESRNGTFTYKEWGRLGFKQEPPIIGFNFSLAAEFDLDGSGSGDDSGDDGSSVGGGGNNGGGVDGGEQCLTGSGADAEEDDGWDETDDLEDDLDVKFTVDEDNFARISLPDFSLSLGFRAPNFGKTLWRHTSGMFVEYTGETSQLLLTRPETYAAGDLSGQNNDIMSSNDKFLDKAMIYAAKQPSTPLGKVCTATACIYRAFCDTPSLRMKALKGCMFLMKTSNLIECLDQENPYTGEPVTYKSLEAFKLCLWNTCNPSEAVCNSFKNYFKPNCLLYVPTAIQNMNCLNP